MNIYCVLKVQVPTVGQPEVMQHDLTKQGNEPQEKRQSSDSSLKLEALKPTPIIKNVAELDYHKAKGKSHSSRDGQPFLILPPGILKLYFLRHIYINLYLFSYISIANSQNIYCFPSLFQYKVYLFRVTIQIKDP